MYLYIHFLTSLVLAGIFYPFIGLYSLWIIVGGFLIDADHYLWSLFGHKQWSMKYSYTYHMEIGMGLRPYQPYEILHIFHIVEFWIGMIVAAIITYALGWTFFFYMFAITFAGMMLHLTLDFFDLIKAKMVDVRAISFIHWLMIRRELKNKV